MIALFKILLSVGVLNLALALVVWIVAPLAAHCDLRNPGRGYGFFLVGLGLTSVIAFGATMLIAWIFRQ